MSDLDNWEAQIPPGHTKAATNESRDDALERGINFSLFILGSVALVIFIATIYAAEIKTSQVDDATGLGTGGFGDAFGFSTSLFTGLAFVGLLFAIRLQRKELTVVRDERKTAQQTLIATKETLNSQIKATDAQIQVSNNRKKAQERERHEARVIRLLDHPTINLLNSREHARQYIIFDTDFADALSSLTPDMIAIDQLLGAQLSFVEPVVLPVAKVTLWLTAWDSIRKSQQYWLHDLLDEKTGNQFNHILIWIYLDRLRKVGSAEKRSGFLNYYVNGHSGIPNYQYPTQKHLESIEDAICKLHLKRVETLVPSTRALQSP